MTLELESYRSSNSPVLMHAPLDIPEICARLKQPHEAQRRRADDRRNVGISTVARKRRLSQDDAKSRHTSAPLVRVSTASLAIPAFGELGLQATARSDGRTRACWIALSSYWSVYA